MTNMNVAFETITPDMALSYLRNGKNRMIKPKVVELYARDMARGEFRTTHQGIAFDEDGTLVDGQHRLAAIIASRKPQVLMVTRGEPKENILVMDRGASRTVRDAISIEMQNLPGANISRTLVSQRVISALNQMIACNYRRKHLRTSSNDIKRMYREFKDSVEAVYEWVVCKHGAKARAPMLGAIIAAASCGVSIDALSKFCGVFFRDDIAGCEDYNVQAALNWKRQIDSLRINGTSLERRKLYLGTQNAIYHFANNTNVTRVVVPTEYRYDVENKIKTALCV